MEEGVEKCSYLVCFLKKMKNEKNGISYHMIITVGEFTEMKTVLTIAPWIELNLEGDEKK